MEISEGMQFKIRLDSTEGASDIYNFFAREGWIFRVMEQVHRRDDFVEGEAICHNTYIPDTYVVRGIKHCAPDVVMIMNEFFIKAVGEVI